jgi:hypothetical protein
MHKFRALAASLLCAAALTACLDGVPLTAPDAPRFDGGGTYGSGGRSAEDGMVTVSSTCGLDRSGGTYGSGGKVETCPTEPTP